MCPFEALSSSNAKSVRAEALERNKRVSPGIGDSWRKIYAKYLRQGTLPAYYDSLRPNSVAIASQLIRGELIDDQRLQKALGNALPRGGRDHALLQGASGPAAAVP